MAMLVISVPMLCYQHQGQVLRSILAKFDKSVSFDKIDADGNNVITREEFANWKKTLPSAVPVKKITFKQYRMLALVTAVPMV